MKIHWDVEQGSDEWRLIRAGVVTASNADKILTPGGKLSAQAKGLINTCIAERLLGYPAEEFAGNAWTERGKELEDEAFAFFHLMTGRAIKKCGFISRDETHNCGCSPDGVTTDSGGDITAGVEIKCPSAAKHIEYLRANDTGGYMPQVQFSMWVTGAQRWYFLSYYPGLPPVLKEIMRDDAWQDGFSAAMPEIIEEIESETERLRQL